MNFRRLSLLAALALASAACHAAEAQCAAADFRPEDVPAHHRMMRRSVASMVRYLAAKVTSSADNAAAVPLSADDLVAAELKYMRLSTNEVKTALVRQESKLLEAENNLLRANKHLNELKKTKAPLADLMEAESAQGAASSAMRLEQKELEALTRRLSSGLRQTAAKKEARRVQFKPGPPQVDKAVTKAQGDKLAAQLELKELKASLANAELTLKLNTPSVQKALAEFTEQSTKADDAKIALDQANKNLADLRLTDADPAVVKQAELAAEAARSAQKAEARKLNALTRALPNQVDKSVMTAIAKHERLAIEAANSNRLGNLVPGPLDLAGTKVVSQSVAEANIAQLKQAIAQTEGRLAEMAKVRDVLVTSAVSKT